MLSGDHMKVLDHLTSFLSEEDLFFSVAEVFSWLNVLLPALIARSDVGITELEIFLKTLASKKFFHCWSFLNLSIELSVKFDMVKFIGDIKNKLNDRVHDL